HKRFPLARTGGFPSAGLAVLPHKNIQYINSYPSDSVQRKILSMYFYQDKSDAQIARKLKLSRQYVNRMKKKLILRYISENK
uniref:sigma factor-like helix-turn-helix DNA-binding protein n=1 Tax=Blautia wexlerae TaxID=418240 RepID=UPI0034A44951